MRILVLTDAWAPQVNGVVRTLENTKRELGNMGHEVKVISPKDYFTLPCPTYPEIRLTLKPRRPMLRPTSSSFPALLIPLGS